jgi:hypothetical protein
MFKMKPHPKHRRRSPRKYKGSACKRNQRQRGHALNQSDFIILSAAYADYRKWLKELAIARCE